MTELLPRFHTHTKG